MIDAILIPEGLLDDHLDRIIRVVADVEPTVSAAGLDVETLRALWYHLLFSKAQGSCSEVIGMELSATKAFYNSLFWLLRFIAAYEATHGYDAGLHQQAFQLLDQAQCELNWSVIEELCKRAGATP